MSDQERIEITFQSMYEYSSQEGGDGQNSKSQLSSAECARSTTCRNPESYVKRMDQLLLPVRKMDDCWIMDLHQSAISQVVKELQEIFNQTSFSLVTGRVQNEPCHVCSLAVETPMIGDVAGLIRKSRVMREYQARFCESLGVQLPLATRRP